MKNKIRKNYILRYYFYKVEKEPPPCKADQCIIMYTHTHKHMHNFIKDKGEVKTKLRGDF